MDATQSFEMEKNPSPITTAPSPTTKPSLVQSRLPSNHTRIHRIARPPRPRYSLLSAGKLPPDAPLVMPGCRLPQLFKLQRLVCCLGHPSGSTTVTQTPTYAPLAPPTGVLPLLPLLLPAQPSIPLVLPAQPSTPPTLSAQPSNRALFDHQSTSSVPLAHLSMPLVPLSQPSVLWIPSAQPSPLLAPRGPNGIDRWADGTDDVD